jgi:WD40 repeat protein
LPNELAIANTDCSIKLIDLNSVQVASFKESDFHTKKVHALKYSNIKDNEHLSHVLYSASEDGCVKIWDRRNGEVVNTLKHNNSPFYSLDTNQNIVCTGAKDELVFWDLRKMKILEIYSESHRDDITGIKFHPTNPNNMLSCGTDNLLCQFSF